jgi:hypothetical protein
MSPENSKLYDEAYKELAKAKTVTISVAQISGPRPRRVGRHGGRSPIISQCQPQ